MCTRAMLLSFPDTCYFYSRSSITNSCSFSSLQCQRERASASVQRGQRATGGGIEAESFAGTPGILCRFNETMCSFSAFPFSLFLNGSLYVGRKERSATESEGKRGSCLGKRGWPFCKRKQKRGVVRSLIALSIYYLMPGLRMSACSKLGFAMCFLG